jgi:hypothetical protein
MAVILLLDSLMNQSRQLTAAAFQRFSFQLFKHKAKPKEVIPNSSLIFSQAWSAVRLSAAFQLFSSQFSAFQEGTWPVTTPRKRLRLTRL